MKIGVYLIVATLSLLIAKKTTSWYELSISKSYSKHSPYLINSTHLPLSINYEKHILKFKVFATPSYKCVETGSFNLISYSPERVNAINTNQDNRKDTTRALVQLVKEAAALIQARGESAFKEFRIAGSRWRKGETYIFVIDDKGNMIVHDDPAMEGKNQLELKDINGKAIIRGLLETATALPEKPEGWYHYQWPVPGGLLPRWKSSYVQLVKLPSGKNYIIGSGQYNDRMEREFVVDLVKDAIVQIEKNEQAAYRLFHDPQAPFMAKDAYIFVVDTTGIELVNPAFPNLEGRNLLDLKDTHGKYLVREMLQLVKDSSSGWVNYMWPKPGESISTQKSTYVSKAKLGNKWVMVGCGVYLDDAPKEISSTQKIAAIQLMKLVRDAAAVFEKQGENAYAEFRKKETIWFSDDTYFFVWSMDGIRILNAGNPQIEGQNVSQIKDILGRPFGKMFIDVAAAPQGEGWVHYMYPEPGDIFPKWKSSFVKRVTFPSGKHHIIGCGIYQMQMDKALIEDIVNRAADEVAAKGKDAFPLLRDKTGPYVFMDTYVFVESTDGIELVNAAQPSLQGKNLMDTKDAKGKYAVREYINKARRNGSAWVNYYWYKPGLNEPTLKYAYVKKVMHNKETYIVGSGFYAQDKQPQ